MMTIDPLEPRFCFAAVFAPDVTFATAGELRRPPGEIEQLLTDNSGRTIFIARTGDIEFGPFGLVVERLTRKGKPDVAFGNKGYVFDDNYGYDHIAAVQADDKVVVATSGGALRLNVDGSLDTAFGNAGRVTFPFTNISGQVRLRINDDGTIRIAVAASTVVQFRADGSPDLAFGDNGVKTAAAAQFGQLTVQDTQFDPAGRLMVVLADRAARHLYLTRLAEDLTVDASFGTDGRVDLGVVQADRIGPASDPLRPTIGFFKNGSFLVNLLPADLAAGDVRLVRYTASGAVERSFGADGRKEYVGGKANLVTVQTRIDPSSDNVYVSVTSKAPREREAYETVRLRPGGATDARFGRQPVTLSHVSPGGLLLGQSVDGGVLARFTFRAAAVIKSDYLFVDGTGGADDFSIDAGGVTFNGERIALDLSTVGGVNVNTGPGADRVVTTLPLRHHVNTGTGDDFIQTAVGNDVIEASFGNDTIYAGLGDDRISDGFGDDLVEAGAGRDTLSAEGGADTLIAGRGNDAVDVSQSGYQSGYGLEDDTRPIIISLGSGHDRLQLFNRSVASVSGGPGADFVTSGNAARATFTGGSGPDTLSGTAANDLFTDKTTEDVFEVRRF